MSELHATESMARVTTITRYAQAPMLAVVTRQHVCRIDFAIIPEMAPKSGSEGPAPKRLLTKRVGKYVSTVSIADSGQMQCSN